MSMIDFAPTVRLATSLVDDNAKQEEKLKNACKDFESMFYDMIYKTMRKTTMDSGLIKKSAGEKIFTEMLDTEMSKKAAEQTKNGIGDMLFEQMKKYLPDQGNNFREDKGAVEKNPYISPNAHGRDKRAAGINVAI